MSVQHIPDGTTLYVVTFPGCDGPLVAYDRDTALEAAGAALRSGYSPTIEIRLVDQGRIARRYEPLHQNSVASVATLQRDGGSPTKSDNATVATQVQHNRTATTEEAD